MVSAQQLQYDLVEFAQQDLTTIQNPGTGFAGWYPQPERTTFPLSLEYVSLPLNTVVKGPKVYDFAILELTLRAIAIRRRQAVVRFWLDFPGRESGIPPYLVQQGLQTREYTVNGNCRGCSRIPNYNDTRLHTCLFDFVAAYGARYDGDKRLYAVQIGLIGFWGEWHTWPLTYTSFNFPSNRVLKRLLDLYHGVFRQTHIQIGVNVAALPLYNLPEYKADVQRWRIGFSDDSLLGPAFSTYIRPALVRSNTTAKYLIASIGGEIFPPLQRCAFRTASCVGTVARVSDILRASRVSWALNSYIFSASATDLERTNANIVAKSMGYRFVAVRAFVSFFPNATTVNVTVRNTGYAPFYGRLRLGIRHILFSLTLTENLHRLLPGSTRAYVANGPVMGNMAQPIQLFLYMYSPNVLDTQFVAFSNANINARGEIPFVIDPLGTTAYPWLPSHCASGYPCG